MSFDEKLQANKTNGKYLIVSKGTSECPYCTRAKNLLTSIGQEYDEILDDGTIVNLIASRFGGDRSFPRIFFRGELIGGFTELQARLNQGQGQTPTKGTQPVTNKASTPATTASDGLKKFIDFTKIKTPEKESYKPSSLEEGLMYLPERRLNWDKLNNSINNKVDSIYDDLKTCMCDGIAETIEKCTPVVAERILESIVSTAQNDPVVYEYLESKIIQLIAEIKNSNERENVVKNFDGECRKVFIDMKKGETQQSKQPPPSTPSLPLGPSSQDGK